MQRAQAAAEDPSLQTPENYQALRLELDEIQNEYNGILQARRVEAGEVSTDYNTPENHIDNRTTEDVGNRSVKADTSTLSTTTMAIAAMIRNTVRAG